MNTPRAASYSKLVLLAFLSQSALYPDQFGNVIFTPPAGWQKTEAAEVLELAPSTATRAESIALFIYRGREVTGDFQTEFASFVQSRIHAGEHVLMQSEIQQQASASGIPVLTKIVAVQDASRQNTLRLYMAFHTGNRMELLALAMPSQEVYKRYEPVLKNFIAQVRFANAAGTDAAVTSMPNTTHATSEPTPTTPAPTGTGGLLGWYVTTSSRQQYNMMSHFYDYIVERYYYYFYPDGRLCQDLPQTQSMDNFNYDLEIKQIPAHCGTYTIAGGKINFKWGNGVSYAYAFKPASGGVQIAGDVYLPINPAENLRLNGAYGFGRYTSTSGAAGQSGVGTEHRIIFTFDGRFTQQGFVGFAGSTGNVGATTSSRINASGTYHVSGYSLELTYTDGHREHVLFFRYPGEEEKAIVINKVLYTRRD